MNLAVLARPFTRRSFFGSVFAAVVLLISGSNRHGPVPDWACRPRDIPAAAVNGDCYVFTEDGYVFTEAVYMRGTYRGWPAPGVPI
jgi:hypothetical protein